MQSRPRFRRSTAVRPAWPRRSVDWSPRPSSSAGWCATRIARSPVRSPCRGTSSSIATRRRSRPPSRSRSRRRRSARASSARLRPPSHLVFSVEQRDALRARVLQLAEDDERVVAGAAVGSLALGGGDRYSDLDLTFAVADGVTVVEVLDDWTRSLAAEADALHLVDLERGSTLYRVFLLPDALQFDL